jgi:sRNA-binding protein
MLPANETISALAQKYPRCFSLVETRRRPLANGIHDGLLMGVPENE